jgi:hypothetical protein
MFHQGLVNGRDTRQINQFTAKKSGAHDLRGQAQISHRDLIAMAVAACPGVL